MNVNLQGTALTRAQLQQAVLVHANLKETGFTGANLQRASLADADLRETSLTGASGLTPQQLAASTGDDTTRLPWEVECPKNWTDERGAVNGLKADG